MNLTLSFKHQTKKILALAGLLVASVTMISLANLALADSRAPSLEADERIINIYDQGEERVIITKSRTVRQALKAADIEINEPKDVVEPSLETELIATKYNINIYRAKTITVVDSANPARKRVATAQQTPEGIAKAAKIELYKEDEVRVGLSNDLLLDGADTVMVINRATPVNLTLFGKQSEVRTRAKTVGELLKEKNITIGENDTLSVDKLTPIVAGMPIEIWRNGKQTVTIEEEVDFPVEKIQDANREIGYREVKTPGEKGKRNATYEIEMKNGQELSRKEIASVVTKEPKKQVEVVGAKSRGGLTKSKGVYQFVDSNGVTHRETYYDLPMGVVMGNCGAGGVYSVRSDGVKVDSAGYVIIAAHLGNYPRCSVVETSLGPGKVYDTGGFVSVHPHGFDIATDWTNYNGR